jgi:hypothetical protein
MKGTDLLSDQFRLANKLARSVSYVHIFEFVHKNIRLEIILLLRSEESSTDSVFLVEFDSFQVSTEQLTRDTRRWRKFRVWENSAHEKNPRTRKIRTWEKTPPSSWDGCIILSKHPHWDPRAIFCSRLGVPNRPSSKVNNWRKKRG